MDHEYEQNREGPATAATTNSHTVAPGQMSRSALLRKSEHPIASGLVRRKPRDVPAVEAALQQRGTAEPLPMPLRREMESGGSAPGAKPADLHAHGSDAGDVNASQAKARSTAEGHPDGGHAAVGGASGATGVAGDGAEPKPELSPGSPDRPATDVAHRGAIEGSPSSNDPGAMLASLGEARPSEAVAALTRVQSASPAAFDAAREQARATIPRIPAPTGLPAKTERSKHGPPADAEVSPEDPHRPKSGGPSPKVPDKLVREAPSAPPLAPTLLPGADAHGTENAGAHDEALAKEAQQVLASVRLPFARVSTQATDVPSVDLSGEAEPAQVPDAHFGASEQTRAASRKAAKLIHHDYGEGDIFPAATGETLTAMLPVGRAEIPAVEAARATDLPPEALASTDAEAAPALHAKVKPEQQKYVQGKARHDTEMKAAHEKHRSDVAATEENARARQQRARSKAQNAVGGARADWQLEIDKVGTEFRAKADTARDEHRGKLRNEQQSANRQAAAHIRTAEREADAEKRRAEDEAAAKKAEANKESKGFWGWVKSKAKALIDGIKAAVNVIYDKLRSTVKAIFDTAKRLALGVIELARKALVGLIKAFGAVLKGFVKIALAAFPQIRDRMLRRIDQAVHKAEQAVNAIAGALKKAVAALIDCLASTIDKILGLIQDLYNAALTVIRMLVSGELQELLGKVGQLVASAKTAPGQFETAAYEELLGGNLDQPLSPAELLAAGRTPSAADPAAPDEASADAAPHPKDNQAGGDHTETDHAAGDHAEGDHAESSEPIPAPPWTEDNVGVDEVARGEELEPQLEDELRGRTGGGDGTVEFGESSDETRSLDYMLGRTGAAGAQAAQAQPAANTQHDAQPQGTQARAATQQPATQVGADGLTPRDRAQVKWQLMKKGLADWWAQKWPYVLAGGVLAVAGFIVANILTGGAILAALPAIMTAVGYVMIGVAILKIVEHVRDFLQKAWNGDIRGGGKSLAKGLAAGAIELIMMLTFKVGAAAVRGARAADRGAVRGAQALARGAVRTGRAAARATARGAQALTRSSVHVVSAAARGIARGVQYVIRAGKVLLRGVGRAISRGVKRLREFGARLLSRSRFKGFRIRINGRWFILEGRINPWVVIVEGEIKSSAKRTKDAHLLTEKQLEELRRGGTPHPNRLSELDARRYHDTTSKGLGKVGDGLTGDHIPSRAALVERFKLDNPGKPVPEDLINREGVTVVLKGTDHATLSRTYAGNNNATRVLEDAKDLAGAFSRDAEAILAGLQRDGRLTTEFVGAYLKAYRANVIQGVFKYSADIDRILNRFLALAKA